ncbi:MAG: M23 family metallopeptidase, partial [Chloroflexota bacterium]
SISQENEQQIRFAKNGDALYANHESLPLWEISRELCVDYELLVAYNYVLLPREPDSWFDIKIPPAEDELGWMPGQSVVIPDHVRLPNGQQIYFEATSPSAFRWPVDSEQTVITQFYRPGHIGVDIALLNGNSVRAIGNGRVDRVFRDHHVYGNMIIIDHGNDIYAHYAHLSSAAVNAETLVQKGQVIGNVGTSGRSSGPHLHLEMRESFGPIDPCLYFEECETSIFHN